MCQACTVDYKSTHLPLFIDDNVFENFTKSVQIAHHTAVDYEQQCEKIGKNLHAQITELSELKEEILSSINTAFQSIYDAVDERKAKLCGEVTATIDNIHKILNSKLTTAQKEKAISVDSQSVLQFVVSHGDGHDVTASKDVVLAHQSVLTSKWLHPELHSTVSQVMTFDQANQDALLKAITEFGIIQAGACPANCILNRKPEDITTKDSNPVQLIVTTFDHENVQCKIGGEKVEAFLCPKFPIPGPAIKAKVVDNKNGKYTITFSLTYRGVCDLSIHVNGNGISNSPFTVFLQPIHDILPEIQENVIVVGTDKTYESYDGGRAVSISVVPNGYTYMVDYDRHLVYVYDRYRRHVRSFGEPGRAYGRILSATGIAVDSKGLVYVSSCFNDRIVVHKQNGTFHAEICHRSHPLDIKIHKDHLYVVNEDRNRIQVYSLNDSNPPIKPVIGSEGSGPGQFMSIRKITFSPDGDMYVTDRVKHCVQVFTSDGEYKRMFGRDNLQSPGETVITNRGYVLVSEYPNNIAVFNTVGQLVQFFSADSHYHIECLAIDHNGDLLVPLDNRKIVVFQFHSNFK
jgi:tripartite motif-containing protein 2/3/tripartite motif-containing protein 71